MIRTVGMACAALAAVFLCWSIGGSAAAQDVPPGAEAVPAPPAAEPISPYRVEEKFDPSQAYDPLQAGRDAYQRAEEARRQAINRQLDTLDYAKWLSTWTAPRVYAYPLPSVYAYPIRRSVRRAYRGVHVGGVVPVITQWSRAPVGVYGYPYYPQVWQPIGHEKVWTGPNGYIYRPIYAEPAPPVPAQVPTPAVAEPPVLIPAEPVPAPPVEPGPREF